LQSTNEIDDFKEEMLKLKKTVNIGLHMLSDFEQANNMKNLLMVLKSQHCF
jgi:hypothetical protein